MTLAIYPLLELLLAVTNFYSQPREKRRDVTFDWGEIEYSFNGDL